jgi:hypothetical protein
MFAFEMKANIKNICPKSNNLSKGYSAIRHMLELPEGRVFLTFCPLSRKLKEKFLCDLCVLSEAGGESCLKINELLLFNYMSRYSLPHQ